MCCSTWTIIVLLCCVEVALSTNWLRLIIQEGQAQSCDSWLQQNELTALKTWEISDARWLPTRPNYKVMYRLCGRLYALICPIKTQTPSEALQIWVSLLFYYEVELTGFPVSVPAPANTSGHRNHPHPKYHAPGLQSEAEPAREL